MVLILPTAAYSCPGARGASQNKIIKEAEELKSPLPTKCLTGHACWLPHLKPCTRQPLLQTKAHNTHPSTDSQIPTSLPTQVARGGCEGLSCSVGQGRGKLLS